MTLKKHLSHWRCFFSVVCCFVFLLVLERWLFMIGGAWWYKVLLPYDETLSWPLALHFVPRCLHLVLWSLRPKLHFGPEKLIHSTSFFAAGGNNTVKLISNEPQKVIFVNLIFTLSGKWLGFSGLSKISGSGWQKWSYLDLSPKNTLPGRKKELQFWTFLRFHFVTVIAWHILNYLLNFQVNGIKTEEILIGVTWLVNLNSVSISIDSLKPPIIRKI